MLSENLTNMGCGDGQVDRNSFILLTLSNMARFVHHTILSTMEGGYALGGCDEMTSTEDRLARLTFVLVPAVIVAIGCGLSLLPRGVVGETFTVLGVWLSFSLPVGVVVGHCALSEADLPVTGRF